MLLGVFIYSSWLTLATGENLPQKSWISKMFVSGISHTCNDLIKRQKTFLEFGDMKTQWHSQTADTHKLSDTIKHTCIAIMMEALNCTNRKCHLNWRTERSTATEIQIQRLGGQDRQTPQKEPQHQPHQQKYNVKIKSKNFKCLFCENDVGNADVTMTIKCICILTVPILNIYSYSLKQILDSKEWLTDDHNFQ